MSERKKLLIIDGNSVLNRAFYGVRPMTTSDGRPTNAIFGFINMIHKQLEKLSPDACGIAFDLRAPTFRHKKCDYYKANRKGMPEELAAQLDGAKRAAEYLGIHVLSLEGYEADDILGTAAKCANNDTDCDYDCYIMTGDRDSFQLVGERSFVLLCTNSDTVFYDIDKIAESYSGLSPKSLIDVKALMGDSSDNIPGVPGIGEKTAVKLICEFSSLDGLYEKLCDSSLSKGTVEKLKNGKDMAYESRFLAEICCDVPLDVSFDALRYHGIKRNELYELLSSFELKSIISRLGLEKKSDESTLSFFDDEEDAEQFTDFSECESVPTLSGEVGIFVNTDDDLIYIDSDEGMFICPATDKNLGDIFADGKITTVLYDSKETCRLLLSKGIPMTNCSFDVMLAEYVVSPSVKGGISDILSGRSKKGFDISDEKQKNLLCTRYLREAKTELCEKIKNDGLEFIYYSIELPLAMTLARTEHEGFRLDAKGIEEYGKLLDVRLEERTANIFALSGGEFNINSPKQLAQVLYEKLSLPALKKTKSGYSTDAETLEKLRPIHPIINEILDYRVVSKLKSTYVDGLLSLCDRKTSRVYTTFKQALTLTGRLSSTEPNLQNIPIRQAEGRELRKFFVAEEGNVLVDADYSQIELRILAALSRDERMCDAFLSGEDIHAVTASNVFGVELSQVTPEMRKSAKAVNFGIVYGISDFSLAGDIGTTRKKAGEYIEMYFSKYPGIRAYLDSLIELATEKGYTSTLFGRRRYIPELSAKNKVMQAFGKRVAMNSPIQGTAADIIKLAMIKTEKELSDRGLSAKLILQVHDELIVECPESELSQVCDILGASMESCTEGKLTLPLEVSLSYGKTWFDAHQ